MKKIIVLILMVASLSIVAKANSVEMENERFYKSNNITLPAANYRIEVIVYDTDTSDSYIIDKSSYNFNMADKDLIIRAMIKGTRIDR